MITNSSMPDINPSPQMPRQKAISERLCWMEALHWGIEMILSVILCLFPKCLLTRLVRRTLANRVFDCDTNRVYLYKSGRAALRALLATIRKKNPERRIAYIPDYTCNVVAAACEAAGYQVRQYDTDKQFFPEWQRLADSLGEVEAPVLILCSMFGAIPALEEQLKELLQINPGAIVVADECQNLVRSSSLGGRCIPTGGIVFSFNDKTCPGAMGGGIVLPATIRISPIVEMASLRLRVLCALGLAFMSARKYANEAWHIARLAICQKIVYKVPITFEHSDCRKPHYDLLPELIYKQSAARAVVSLWSLDRYALRRLENGSDLANFLTLTVNREKTPPYAAIREESLAAFVADSPFPLKAPYACNTKPDICNRRVFSAKINIPYVRYS